MFSKLAILFFAFLQLSNGVPLETDKLKNDLKSFFSPRIVGGVDAPYGFSRYMTALVWGYPVSSLVCGGSIITKRHVLSAAHCIEPFVHWGELSPSFRGVIGTNYWNATHTKIQFCGYKNHPGWNWANIKNDVGLLITASDIQFNHLVTPIALSSEWVAGGQRGLVTGWGRLGVWQNIPYRLQILFVTILSPEQCYRYMEKAQQIWGFGPPVHAAVEICTLHSVGHGMCHGDSGSALVYKNKQVGIVSWGYPCALGAPDVFVRISAFNGFIEDTIREYNCCGHD
ncbi:jg3945 [Pararge aegeria aegeria]|uniref:Jg3945 protein n=2 Tax=Pararge aegeria TaxID=116150 RepID=A0A8S4RV37_9NEOP|nr:jg3945 [Pararge aegeria aegeria]